MLTNEEIQAMRERCEKATPGPWVCRVVEDGIRPRVFVTRTFGVEVPPKFYIAFLPDMCFSDSEADAEFIAAARTDIPRLLAEREELLAEIERLKR